MPIEIDSGESHLLSHILPSRSFVPGYIYNGQKFWKAHFLEECGGSHDWRDALEMSILTIKVFLGIQAVNIYAESKTYYDNTNLIHQSNAIIQMHGELSKL